MILYLKKNGLILTFSKKDMVTLDLVWYGPMKRQFLE